MNFNCYLVKMKLQRWCYKTVHYELKKEGLLGSNFLDEAEIEESLNEYGRGGWELVSIMNIHAGIIAIFKQPMGIAPSSVEVQEKELIEKREQDVEGETRETVTYAAAGKNQSSGLEDETPEEDDGVGVIRIE